MTAGYCCSYCSAHCSGDCSAERERPGKDRQARIDHRQDPGDWRNRDRRHKEDNIHKGNHSHTHNKDNHKTRDSQRPALSRTQSQIRHNKAGNRSNRHNSLCRHSSHVRLRHRPGLRRSRPRRLRTVLCHHRKIPYRLRQGFWRPRKMFSRRHPRRAHWPPPGKASAKAAATATSAKTATPSATAAAASTATLGKAGKAY